MIQNILIKFSTLFSAYNVTAEDIMDRGIPCIAEKSTIQEIYEIISVGPKYRAYPIVNDNGSIKELTLYTTIYSNTKSNFIEKKAFVNKVTLSSTLK